MGICESLRPADEMARFEVALPRARVLLRLDRPDKAIDALRGCAYTPLDADAFVTAEMLLGAAYIRLDQVPRGVAILERAYAEKRDLHETVRAEVALNYGIARYIQGRMEEAEALLSSVPSSADIIHARAQEYLGWHAYSRSDFHASAAAFRAALACIDRCKHRDRFVEANVLQGLSSVCPELLQSDDWHDVERRIRSFDWTANGLSKPLFWTALNASIMCELIGEVAAAREWVRTAEYATQESGRILMAQCRMAALFESIGEREAQLEFVHRAQDLYQKVSLRDLSAEMRQVPLCLAEALISVGELAPANRLIQQYRDIVEPIPRKAFAEGRLAAFENSVDAALLEASGQKTAAIRLYETSFAAFDSSGLRRRACVVANRLAKLTSESKYVDYMRAALASVPRYWLAAEVATPEREPTLRLSRGQADILDLVAEGKTYKEIAALRGGSWKTARNLVHALFRKFDVRSKGELVAAAARRGLLDRSAKDSAQ
jgi:DNA-binding CsgD family transcriptional regulator